MKAMRSLKLVLAASLMFSAMPLAAAESSNKKIKESGNWSLWEANSGATCYVQSAGESDYYFVVIKSKNNPDSPVEIMVQLLNNPRKQIAAVAAAPGLNSTIAFRDANGKMMTFHGIPKNLSHFLYAMQTNKEITVTGVGGKKPEAIKISTRGFQAMLTEMQNRCNGGASLVNPLFENNFMNAVADNIDPLVKLDNIKSGQIRSIYFAAYPIANKIAAAQGELAGVLNKYKPFSDELTANRTTAGRIQNTDLPNARNTLAASQKQQVDSRAELARLDASIAPLTAKVAASQKALDAVEAIIAPHRPEYNRITGNLSDAQDALDAAESRLSYIEGRLREGSQQIYNLDYEARSLENMLPQKRSEAQRARSIYREASSQRASYNLQWERDSRLRNNFEYMRVQREHEHADRQLDQAEREEQAAKNEVRNAQLQLQQCRSQPMLAEQQVVPGRPGFPGRPGRPRPPGHPGEPTPDDPPPGVDPGPSEPPPQPPPPRDCSAYEMALNNANARYNQADSESDRLKRQVRDLHARMDYIVSQVDSEVRREYDILVQREDSAREESDRRDRDLSHDENRVAQIRQNELPRLQSEQSSLSAERPHVQSTIRSSESSVAQYSRELSAFKAKTGWEAKATAVNEKQRQLDMDESNLSRAQAGRATEQRRLDGAIVTEAQTKTLIDSLNSQLAALNNRAVQLNQSLAGLPAERAVVDQKIAALETDLRARQQQMLTLLQ